MSDIQNECKKTTNILVITVLIQVGYWCQRNLKEKKETNEPGKWTNLRTSVLKETRSKENIIPLRSEIDNLKMKVQSRNRFHIEEVKSDSVHNICIGTVYQMQWA